MDTDPAELPADVKQNMTRYKAPPGLERRIRHGLRAEGSRGLGWFERVRASWKAWLPVGASFACGALFAVAVMANFYGANEEDAIEQQVVAGHVRSLMVGHLTDVASTDQHTVKPWFTGKLDFAPPVVDLAQQGFPLAGGRLDYLQERAVAALVYRRRGHTINVFVLPAGDARTRMSATTAHHGFQLFEWESAGMHFWAVSDVSRDDMAQFVAAFKAAL